MFLSMFLLFLRFVAFEIFEFRSRLRRTQLNQGINTTTQGEDIINLKEYKFKLDNLWALNLKIYNFTKGSYQYPSMSLICRPHPSLTIRTLWLTYLNRYWSILLFKIGLSQYWRLFKR